MGHYSLEEALLALGIIRIGAFIRIFWWLLSKEMRKEYDEENQEIVRMSVFWVYFTGLSVRVVLVLGACLIGIPVDVLSDIVNDLERSILEEDGLIDPESKGNTDGVIR